MWNLDARAIEACDLFARNPDILTTLSKCAIMHDEEAIILVVNIALVMSKLAHAALAELRDVELESSDGAQAQIGVRLEAAV